MKKLPVILPMLTVMILISCSGGNSDSPTDGGETGMYDVTITISPDGAGTVSPSADGSYEAGETVELEAAANDGYLFAGWTGNVEESDNPLSLTINQDYTLIANFRKKNYELIVNTEGDGTVTERIVPQKTAEYEHGTVVELTAEPADGYTFVEWEGALTSSENPVQITMNGPKEITAVFERETLTITAHTTGEGTVSIIPDQEEYEYGTTVALFAEPDENWEFVEWQGDVSSTENPLEMTVDESKEVTAVFEQLPFYLAKNGVTVKCPDAEVGETGTVDGTTFTKRTADQITSSNAVTICTSGITDMSELFRNETDFNEDISHWDVSSVIDMEGMFIEATSFKQDIGDWDVSSVIDMSYMFYIASAFNHDIGGWDVSKVTDMEFMFYYAGSFNQDIGGWDVSSVEGMSHMLYRAGAFNQDISSWCVENISSEPTDFSHDSPLTENHKPAWGTCPE